MEFPGERLVIRLWETLTDGAIGGLLKPWQKRRMGRVRTELRREELLMLAQAEVDIRQIQIGRMRLDSSGNPESLPAPTGTADVEDAVGSTIEIGIASLSSFAQRKRAIADATAEVNVAKAIIHAEECLSGEEQTPSEEPVKSDWLNEWRDHASHVTDSELQTLWGRILADEVKAPGSFTLRTLEFLRHTSKEEAQEIAHLFEFVVSGLIYRDRAIQEKRGPKFGLLLKMQAIGILSGVEAVGMSVPLKSADATRFVRALISHNKVLLIEHEDKTRVLKLPCYALTAVGEQLAKLGHFEANVDYLADVGAGIVKQGFHVKLGAWKQVTPTEGQVFDEHPIV